MNIRILNALGTPYGIFAVCSIALALILIGSTVLLAFDQLDIAWPLG